MCRATTEHGEFSPISNPKQRHHLKIRSFTLRFPISSKLPETLTLIYLPRINGSPLEINGAKIRADVPSFVALHRARSMERPGSEAVYVSTDRVRVSEAVRFEAYVGSRKCIKGVFRRRAGGTQWGLECESGSEADVGRVEVMVGGERGVVMREIVEGGKEKGRREKKGFCLKLEEIVEEVEREGCDCCYCCEEEEEEEEEWEMVDEEEGERVKWVMEMGIWVMCVGVGYLVSKASYKGLRRRRII